MANNVTILQIEMKCDARHLQEKGYEDEIKRQMAAEIGMGLLRDGRIVFEIAKPTSKDDYFKRLETTKASIGIVSTQRVAEMSDALDAAYLRGMEAVLSRLCGPIEHANGDYRDYRMVVARALAEVRVMHAEAKRATVWHPMNEAPYGRRILYRFENGMVANSPVLKIPELPLPSVTGLQPDGEPSMVSPIVERTLHAIAWCDRGAG